MNTPRLITVVAVALVALVAAPAARAQTPGVTIQTLPGFGFATIATAINNDGDVAGVAQLGDGSLHAVLWSGGSLTDLSLSCPTCGTISIAYDINDHDQVVGYAINAGAPMPFVVTNGVMRPLPLPPGHDAVGLALKITNGGRIVGFAGGTAGMTGVLWTSPTAAPQTISIQAAGANDAGDVAGVVTNLCGQQRAAVIRGGVPIVLDPGDVCADGYGSANDVNEAGIVGGNVLGGTGGQRAASWNGLTRTVYEPVAGFMETMAGQKPVNDEADFIGTSVDYSIMCSTQATAWLPEGTIALHSPTLDGSGCDQSVAFAINRYAQGAGVTYDGFRLVATVWNIGVDRRPPAVTAATTTDIIAPPNGRMVPITFTGTITDETAIASASFSVTDEYGMVQPSGPITVNAAGQYSVTVLLEARRNGPDRDGRLYTFTATASDPRGRTASASATTAVRVGKPVK